MSSGGVCRRCITVGTGETSPCDLVANMGMLAQELLIFVWVHPNGARRIRAGIDLNMIRSEATELRRKGVHTQNGCLV